MKRVKRKPWTLVRVALNFLNLMSTFVTLFTGLRENLVISAATGRYDAIRQRFLSGSINLDIIEPDQYRLQDLPTMEQLAGYNIITTPQWSIATFGEDVSVCTNVNTNSAPVMISKYDDYWGKTSRRIQTYVNSISAPNCEILNVRPEWREQCVAEHNGNATMCHEYILSNFDELRKNRRIRMFAEKDFGVAGTLFLRCAERPLKPFAYKSDRLAYQAFWNGGDYHVTVMTSTCRTEPLVQTGDLHHTLFEAFDIGNSADMVMLLPISGWFAFIVPWLHGFLTIILVGRGMVLALFHTSVANYLPNGIRFKGSHKWTRYFLPFMEMITRLSDNERAIITFKGSLIAASDFWMNHWLYMWVSILDAAVNIRSTYVTFQIAQSLLVVRITFVSMIYLLLAMSKITWIMCLVQTGVRILMRIFVRCVRSARLIKSSTREHWEWHIDGLFMFLSYRVYYFIFFLMMMLMLQVKGDISFMKREEPYKVGAFGGPVEIEGFLGSEVVCDLFTILALLTAVSFTFGLFMLWTKYRYVASNSVMRFLQQRYVLCGWDGLLAADVLGLDPYVDGVVVEEHAYTKFSLGSLLQLLYLAGPSGYVHLAGDYIFHDNGFSKDPVRFAYPIPKAMDMGLFNTTDGSGFSSGVTTTTGDGAASSKYMATQTVHPIKLKEAATTALATKRSIFERKLRVVSDGFFGKILFIDASKPGQISANKETGQREYEVIDALTTMSILDIKYLMGREKKICVE